MSVRTMPLYKRYSMIVEWSDEDDAYIVTVPELPGCRTHGTTHAEAVEMGEEAIEGWIEAAQAWNRPVPPPMLFAGQVAEDRAAR